MKIYASVYRRYEGNVNAAQNLRPDVTKNIDEVLYVEPEVKKGT